MDIQCKAAWMGPADLEIDVPGMPMVPMPTADLTRRRVFRMKEGIIKKIITICSDLSKGMFGPACLFRWDDSVFLYKL